MLQLDIAHGLDLDRHLHSLNENAEAAVIRTG